MALPSPGQISFSEINTELGRSSTAQISLTDAATGGYVSVNNCSTSRPNSSTPHEISEWYGYNHTVSCSSSTEIFLNGPWSDSTDACSNGPTAEASSYFVSSEYEGSTVGAEVYVDDTLSEYVSDGIYYDTNLGAVVEISSGFIGVITGC